MMDITSGQPMKDESARDRAAERKAAEACDALAGPAQARCVQDAADADCKRCPDLTLGRACALAVFAASRVDDKLAPDQRWAYAKLADELQSNRSMALGTKQVEIIKHAVETAKFSGVLIMQIYPRIDPVGSPKAPELK